MPETLTDVVAELKAIRAALDAAARPPAELMDRPGMAHALNVGLSTLDKLTAAGEVGPRPFKVGGAVRWHRAEVTEWLRHRKPNGELYDAKTWPPLWAELQRRTVRK